MNQNKTDLGSPFDSEKNGNALIIKALAPIPAKRLNPSFEIEGEEHVLVTQFMSAIPVSVLKNPVTNLSASHDEIVSALDMAFHGF